MANWTVSSWSNAETAGDSVNAGTIGSTAAEESGGYVDLTISAITPNVISATDFKIGGSSTESPTNTWTGGNVDAEVYKVAFSDNGTAAAVGNTVNVRVYFDSTAMGGTPWTMPTNNDTIYIDIDEKTTVSHKLRYLCINSFHDAETDGNVNKHTVTYASAPTGITTTNNTPLVHNLGDGAVTHNHQGAVTEGPTFPGHQIFQVTFAANTLYGYYYAIPPTYVLQATAHQSYYQVLDSSSVIDANNNLTSITYTVYYTPPVNVYGLDPDPYGDAGGMCELGHDIEFNHDLKQRQVGEPGSSPLITSVITETTIIPQAGTSRQIAVVGFTQAVFKLVLTRTGDGHTYDFLTDTFTSAATTSTETTVGITGYQYFDVIIPAITSNATYDITIVPTSPTTTSIGVPLVAGDLRWYQYIDVVITLGILDGGGEYDDGELLDGSPNTAITITGKAGHDIGSGGIRKAFSYTINESMVTSIGSDSLVANTANDFSLDNQGSVTTLTDGAASSATQEVDSTTGIVVGNTINWSVDKTPLFSEEAISEIQVGTAGQGDSITIPPNIDNLTVGMILSASNIRRTGDDITITAIGTSSVTISEEITTDSRIDITFTAAGITVGTVNANGTTLIASQSLNLTDNLSLTFGGQQADVEASVTGGTSTQSGDNVILAGFFVVDSFPIANTTVKIDVDKLITIE